MRRATEEGWARGLRISGLKQLVVGSCVRKAPALLTEALAEETHKPDPSLLSCASRYVAGLEGLHPGWRTERLLAIGRSKHTYCSGLTS